MVDLKQTACETATCFATPATPACYLCAFNMSQNVRHGACWALHTSTAAITRVAAQLLMAAAQSARLLVTTKLHALFHYPAA